MSRPYFRQVPNFDYVSRLAGNKNISDYIQVKNLFKRAKFRPDIEGNLSFFTNYTIIGDERPDNVAYKFYDDETLDWIIDFKTSDKIKPEEWIENYFVQEMFYAAAYYEITKIPPVKLITLMVTPGGEVKVFDKRNKEDYIRLLVRYIKEFVHHNTGSNGE